MQLKSTKNKLIAVIVLTALVTGIFLFRNKDLVFNFKKPYVIGVIANSVELSPDDMEMVKVIVNKKVNAINTEGGIAGRNVRVIYLDDKGDTALLQKQIKETMNDKNLLGYVGCWSSTRAKAASALVGPARVPFIGGYAMTPLFEHYPSMFSVERGIKEVNAVFKNFLQKNFKKTAVIGKEADLYTNALVMQMHHLSAEDPTFQVVMEKWIPFGHKFTDADIKAFASELKSKESDFLLLSFESSISADLIQSLRKVGVTIPIFTVLGDLGLVVSLSKGHDVGELYDIHVIGIPGTLNLRLQEIIHSLGNRLKYSDKMEFQLTFGGRLADAIGIMAESANANTTTKAANIREKIINGLGKYIGGKHIYRGWYADWYFTEDRAVAGDVLLAWKPKELTHHILAPDQFAVTNDSSYRIPIFNTHIDMVKINRVNDVDGSFYATFYIELASAEPVSIQQIDFTNAARNELNHDPLLNIRLIKKTTFEGKPTVYSYIYKVSGKFFFDPDLRKYPFDEQKFTISFQPISAVYPFVIQPSGRELRDTVFTSIGWTYKEQYVGYDQDVISFINTFSNIQQTLPFYKFSYNYVMKRVRIDFFLKILTPLLIILVITYFSVYIPLHKFETLEAIQVTSLLASIALYFSSYKPATEYATISDKIFIFTYLMITSLIGTSILRYVERKRNKREHNVAKIYQLYVFPIIVISTTVVILL